jgi:hypothetical protein
MADFLKKVRVRATPVVLVNNRAADSFADTLSRCSTDTDLLLLGLRDHRSDKSVPRHSISGASCNHFRPPCWFEVPRSRIFYKPRKAHKAWWY